MTTQELCGALNDSGKDVNETNFNTNTDSKTVQWIWTMGSQPILITKSVTQSSQYIWHPFNGSVTFLESELYLESDSVSVNIMTHQPWKSSERKFYTPRPCYLNISIWSESVLPATVPAAEKAVSSAVSPPWAESRDSSDLTEPSPARSPNCSSYKTQR